MAKKPIVTTLQSGFNSTETLNANFEALRDSFDNTLSLDGSTPNAMEADLDLNGNDIINASVIGTSSLVVNGKLISVSNDPVFDGTVSVFGANLIADVDAAAVKTTLGLSTVASTGSYTDLSNQPSFASPAQGALADSSVQPTDTQATSAWTTGTATTEGIVSPAKIKSAVLANETLTPTSGTAPYFGVRSWCKFDGTGLVAENCSIAGSGNVASVLKTNSGTFTLTFSTAMPDANYSITFSGSEGSVRENTSQSSINVFSQTVGGFEFVVSDATSNSYVNRERNYITVVG